MYADRYAGRRGLSPGGLAFALSVSGVVLFGLSLTTATSLIRVIDPPLVTKNIPIDEPPPPDPKPQHVEKQLPTTRIDPIDVTKPIVVTDPVGFTAKPVDLTPPVSVTVGSDAETHIVIPPHVPVLRDPALDQRYIDNFQPNYPSDERLAGRGGRVVVSVLIGTDGRVKDVRQVSAASSAFFEATRKQALAKWRFKPGTKDGEAVEAWHTMAVSFVLNEE